MPSAGKHEARAKREEVLFNGHLLLTENGISLFMWIGLQVDPSWLNQVFGAHTIGQVDIEMVGIH